ncbi:MAG: ABC transporter permease [Clostridium sp.]|nr:ABC transporter permease [Clostridium sp.]
MYGRWILFRLEMKKFMAMVPLILAETLLVGLLLLGIGFCAGKALYGEKAVGEIRVGVVTHGEDKLTEMLLGFVESMDSVRDTVSFVRLSEEEAREEVLAGELYGAVLVPEGIVDSVNSGENAPATVLLAGDYSQAETEVFAQLTKAGEGLLSVAQAGIYAADAFCAEEGRPEKIQEAEDYLNREYLDYAMGRSSFFKEREVSAAQGVSLGDYYGISLLIAFVSFIGLAFGKYMQVETGQRERLVGRWGVRTGQRYLIEAAAFGCVSALMGTALGFLLYVPLGSLSGSTFVLGAGWLWMMLVWFETGVFLRMLFQMTGNHAGGMGLCFGIQMALMLAAGVFVPEAFLPLWVEKLGRYIPYKNWMESLGAALQNRFGAEEALLSAARILAFLLAGVAAALLRDRRDMTSGQNGAGVERTAGRRRKAGSVEHVVGEREREQRQERRAIADAGKKRPLKNGTKHVRGKISSLYSPPIRQKLAFYRILWKQYWIKHRVWIVGLLLTAAVFGIMDRSFFDGQENQGISVGICVCDEKGRELLAGLKEKEGIFRFEGYESKAEMLREIKNGGLECGYVFPEGFYDKLADKKLKRQAELYYSPASSVHRIAGEAVFARLFEMLSPDILEKYLAAAGYGGTADFDRARERLYELNDLYRSNGSTFHFIYESKGGKSGEKPVGLNTVRGLAALAMFLMGILGLGNMLEQKNTWLTLPGRLGKDFKSGSLHVAALGSILTGGICLWLSGNMGEPVRELTGLVLYLVALEVFLRLLGLIVTSSRGLYGLIPAFLLCSCLFCPIFIRVERYLPALAWISRLFPISYYLELFL